MNSSSFSFHQKKRPIKKIGRYINAVPPNFHLYLYRWHLKLLTQVYDSASAIFDWITPRHVPETRFNIFHQTISLCASILSVLLLFIVYAISISSFLNVARRYFKKQRKRLCGKSLIIIKNALRNCMIFWQRTNMKYNSTVRLLKWCHL